MIISFDAIKEEGLHSMPYGISRCIVAIIPPTMSDFPFTPEQRKAIETVDRSVIVSAAAGSGKTAVLAERCIYLVCDASPPFRCNIDELLVLTFTEAAAAEMRARILDKLNMRLEARAADSKLHDQLARVTNAQITTIHSFCYWMLRRWFNEAGIDPATTILDEKEMKVLRREVLEALLESKYASLNTDRQAPIAVGRFVDAVIGSAVEPTADRTETTVDSSPDSPEAFHRLIDVYGLGDDHAITEFLLRLNDFLASITDPEHWLNEAVASVESCPEEYVLGVVGLVSTELERQRQHCDRLLKTWERSVQPSDPYLQRVLVYQTRLDEWGAAMSQTRDSNAASEMSREQGGNEPMVAVPLRQFDAVISEIRTFEFQKIPPKYPGKGESPIEEAGRRSAYEELRDDLLRKQLRESLAVYSSSELLDSVRRTAPFVKTIVELVRAFAAKYQERKRQLAVMDFADLERLAYQLLRSPDDPEKPSAIAKQLQERFAHVLVDEFQDINPLQRSILRLVSRETDPNLADNLFVVGDVKQSIYRFRQAEPALFLHRWNEFHHCYAQLKRQNSTGSAIPLQHNFRSRFEIIETANMIFRRLMRRGTSAIVYDDEAELRQGREPNEVTKCPVELHLLESRATIPDTEEDSTEEASEGSALTNADQPARWTPIEREAYLIATRIREWLHSTSFRSKGDPLRYCDIAILLRSKKKNARLIANVLSKMGIPAVADESGSLFDAREIKDVLAGLQVLDNQHQDIPLASVLRSGLLGITFSEDELVEIRLLDRDIPFHEAVRRYGTQGSNPKLRDRLATILQRLDRFRADFHRKPLSDALSSLYNSFGFFGYVGGLPQGPLRQANLHALHDLARKQGSFRRQGLHRFLAFLQALQDGETELSSAASPHGAENAVRIMSIHGSKGLQFPVVFLAGMGTKFNFKDRNNRLIFERQSRIGLRVVDTRRMVEFPSAAHMLASAEIERTTREEEMRLLYVAMTRAEDKLVLIGSKSGVDAFDLSTTSPQPVSELDMTRANTYLDWVLPVLLTEKNNSANPTNKSEMPFMLVKHDSAEIAKWRLNRDDNQENEAIRKAVASGSPLSQVHAGRVNDSLNQEIRHRLDFVYPNLASTTIRAAMGASEFKGAFDFTQNPEAVLNSRPANSIILERGPSESIESAATRGIVNHRVLQHLDFVTASDQKGLDRELQRMLDAKLISEDEYKLVDCESIAWFIGTPLAQSIRLAGKSYRREFTYISKEKPSYFERTVPDDDESVLVRGIIDGILETSTELEIVDFKTDTVAAYEAETRAIVYRPQMQMYARAMTRIWKKPVTACQLVFLSAQRIVAISQEQLGHLDPLQPTM